MPYSETPKLSLEQEDQIITVPASIMGNCLAPSLSLPSPLMAESVDTLPSPTRRPYPTDVGPFSPDPSLLSGEDSVTLKLWKEPGRIPISF